MLLPHVDVARADGVALLGVEPPDDLAHHDAVKDDVGVADVVHAHDGAGGLLHGLVAARARALARAMARVCVQWRLRCGRRQQQRVTADLRDGDVDVDGGNGGNKRRGRRER